MTRVDKLCKLSQKGYATSMVVTNHNKKVCTRLLFWCSCFCYRWHVRLPDSVAVPSGHLHTCVCFVEGMAALSCLSQSNSAHRLFADASA